MRDFHWEKHASHIYLKMPHLTSKVLTKHPIEVYYIDFQWTSVLPLENWQLLLRKWVHCYHDLYIYNSLFVCLTVCVLILNLFLHYFLFLGSKLFNLLYNHSVPSLCSVSENIHFWVNLAKRTIFWGLAKIPLKDLKRSTHDTNIPEPVKYLSLFSPYLEKDFLTHSFVEINI